MWPPTVYELVWPQGLFGWPPDHMGWFALLLLVKFKTPGWFYFISYSYQVVHFGGWEHCVKVWWVTRSKSKVSRPLFIWISWGNSSIHVATTHRMTHRCGKIHTLLSCEADVGFKVEATMNVYYHTYVALCLVTHSGMNPLAAIVTRPSQ